MYFRHFLRTTTSTVQRSFAVGIASDTSGRFSDNNLVASLFMAPNGGASFVDQLRRGFNSYPGHVCSLRSDTNVSVPFLAPVFLLHRRGNTRRLGEINLMGPSMQHIRSACASGVVLMRFVYGRTYIFFTQIACLVH